MTRRRVTRPGGSGPDYIGIGANRCGTTSLHYALVAHSHVKEYRGKEMHFWDKKVKGKGAGWYLNRFRTKPGHVAGEVTPAYYRIPGLPTTLHHYLPNVKLLLLLRNPVDALFSDYRRGVHRRGFPWGFEEYVERVLDGDAGTNPEFFARRYYDLHLTFWLAHFPREQVWVAQSEKLFANPAPILNSLWEFLDVPQRQVRFQHTRASSPRPIFCRERLSEHFQPHNQRLYALLGEEYDWD